MQTQSPLDPSSNHILYFSSVQAVQSQTTADNAVILNSLGNIDVGDRRVLAAQETTTSPSAKIDLEPVPIDNSAVDLSIPILSFQGTPITAPAEAELEEMDFHVRFHEDNQENIQHQDDGNIQHQDDGILPDIQQDHNCTFNDENAVLFLSTLEEHVNKIDEKNTGELREENASPKTAEDTPPKPPQKKTRKEEVPSNKNICDNEEVTPEKVKVVKKGKTIKRKSKRR